MGLFVVGLPTTAVDGVKKYLLGNRVSNAVTHTCAETGNRHVTIQ